MGGLRGKGCAGVPFRLCAVPMLCFVFLSLWRGHLSIFYYDFSPRKGKLMNDNVTLPCEFLSDRTRCLYFKKWW